MAKNKKDDDSYDFFLSPPQFSAEIKPMIPIQMVAQFLVGTSDVIKSATIGIDEDGISLDVKLNRDLPEPVVYAAGNGKEIDIEDLTR